MSKVRIADKWLRVEDYGYIEYSGDIDMLKEFINSMEDFLIEESYDIVEEGNKIKTQKTKTITKTFGGKTVAKRQISATYYENKKLPHKHKLED